MRPFYVSLAWTARDYVKRVWDNSAEDNVLFLASGIAFNILLAAVPFVLLLAYGLSSLLPALLDSPVSSTDAVLEFVDRLLPAHAESGASGVHTMLVEALKPRASLGIYSAVGFVWFSTRLFGSLRTVLAYVFDIETERGIIAGKIFDIKITVMATLLFVASTAITTYIAVATTRGISALRTFGLRDDVMGGLEYWIGPSIAFVILALMFWGLYKFLPVRRVRSTTAWVAALFATVMFEVARVVFTAYVATFNPASFYAGTLISIIVVVVWCYYAALIFLLGGEVGQVYELRKMRRRQREILT